MEETASLRGAALYMQRNKTGCLPVVRGEALAGIITDSDFIAAAINLMEQLEEVVLASWTALSAMCRGPQFHC